MQNAGGAIDGQDTSSKTGTLPAETPPQLWFFSNVSAVSSCAFLTEFHEYSPAVPA